MNNIIELLLSQLRDKHNNDNSSKEICLAIAQVIKNEPVEALAELYQCLSALMVSLTHPRSALTADQWDIVRDAGGKLIKLSDKLDPELAKKYGLHKNQQCECGACTKRREDLHE